MKGLLLGLMLAGSCYADGVWWYTSANGPYDDECAHPYAYANSGNHSYPYDMYDHTKHGRLLYGAHGHVHEVKKEVKKEVVYKILPVEEPVPFDEPRAKPEGD